ncbi:FimV/HubP family polar landmark protein [Burkholderia sp. SIMBA_043]|uniref:FimV/HubP family polar landmark protein n=1 Tax=Burkholderia TaxID=32008 RepID=UPI0005D9932B|nr:FimV/HubP family polar landmark protein [Burkholderia vietnamiensis]AJY03957.1 putative fimV C-domain protein [Burkholderia vietnamiensis LMG 10929]AVR11984.1 pilus assembly protein FimV [Burkholderia vietnamiensis]KVM43703.1 pilus assembly protein FimV [Burkholderia vietnamiensis]KVS00871.1 pilus assembly protein FimV [Burkholderia vietnamiensis]UBI24634.1 pilus assembly protein FimV [Burkholderia vietnamiensis]
MSRNSLFPRQSRLSRAVCGALAVLALGAAASAGAASPGEQPASAAGGAVPLTVTVQPGQSLNDLAKAATQSHDPGVLARAGRALFDANPQAFMKRDPSRLKVGATLTVPALDATGAALVPAGAGAASGASAGSAAGGGSATVAGAQHGASAAHPGSAAVAAPTASAVSSAPIAPAAPAAPTSSANAPAANGASSSAGASATHGASSAATAQPAAPVGGASGPHVWNGAIQSAPSSASEAAAQPAAGGAAQHAQQPPAAAPAASASQPRPSSLQQLLALKNRVLMELQNHGIGKPAPSGNVAPAPAAVRPVQGDVAASGAASSAVAGDAASGAASGAAASAVAPASAPVPPVVTSVAPPSSPRATGQMDWRPAAAAGAAVVVLIAGFAWRKRRKARAADAAAASSADVPPAQSRDTAPVDTDLDASPRAVEPVPPTLPATPFSRDAATDVSLVTAAAVAAETADVREADVAPPPEEASTHDDHAEAEAEAEAEAPAAPAAALPPDVPAAAPAAADAPAETAPAAPTPTDTQHEALMQNAINALNSLDMPLPPRIADEHAVPQAPEAQTESEQSATNGQAAPRPPLGATEASDERSVEHDDEFDWDPDATTPAEQAGGASTVPTPSSLPPLGARFGALKLDFDLDLPSAPDAELPALTPEELARIARNKLDLALEYVELGDLSGARTLLQEVVDANDAATRDDARALLAKLAADA